jgi:glycosyltransferase involved in cell wall biosynthesis
MFRINSLQGKHVGMVCFSEYPDDPRPRRAIAALLQEGMSVDFICLGARKSPSEEAPNGLRIRRVAIQHQRGGALAYAYQYSAFILSSAAILAIRALRRRYDLVYVHNMPDILVASALIPKLLGAKVILDQHDPMPELFTTIFGLPKRSLAVRVVEYLERWSFAQANRVIAVNVACKRIFGERSCLPEKIAIVMNSPDDRIFGAQPRQPRMRDAGSGQFVIMYHGSMVERNGLDLAVSAVAQVRQVIPGVELRIFGRKTPFLDRVMADVRRNDLGDCVRYLGPKRLEELVQAIEDCDVGIVPNQRNAFTDINTPTRIFEYLALGKPVIAPRTPGIQDYFGPNELLFFKAGDPEDLSRQIEYAALRPRETLDTVGRGQQVYAAHAWKQERHNLLNLVSDLVNGNG